MAKEQGEVCTHNRRALIRASNSAQHAQAQGRARCSLDERHNGMRSSGRERVPFGGIPHTHPQHTPGGLQRLARCCICACRRRRVRASARLAQRLRARCPGHVLYVSIKNSFCVSRTSVSFSFLFKEHARKHLHSAQLGKMDSHMSCEWRAASKT